MSKSNRESSVVVTFRINRIARWVFVILSCVIWSVLLFPAFRDSNGSAESILQALMEPFFSPLVILFAIFQLGSLLTVTFNRIEFHRDKFCLKRWWRSDRCILYSQIVEIIDHDGSDYVYFMLTSGEAVDIPKHYSSDVLGRTEFGSQIREAIDKCRF